MSLDMRNMIEQRYDRMTREISTGYGRIIMVPQMGILSWTTGAGNAAVKEIVCRKDNSCEVDRFEVLAYFPNGAWTGN